MEDQIIILQGGEDINKKTNYNLFKHVQSLSSTKRVLIIPWSSNSTKEEEKERQYRGVLSEYFSDSGFKDVLFLEKDDDEYEVGEKFSLVDSIYLPGGDPEILFREMNLRSLQYRLKKFKGVIIGNSAGAIVLSKGSLKRNKFYPGFGLVNFFVSVHYNFDSNNASKVSEERIVNIPEDMWICVT